MTLLFEGFEGNFPEDNGWTVRDANPNGPAAFWDDVDLSFGGEGTHSGLWKGYCAGIGYGGTTDSPTYQNYMNAVMLSPALDLTGYSAAALSFWHKIPSIETCFLPDCNYDYCSVWILDEFGGVEPAWTANTTVADWTQVTIDLSKSAGHRVWLAFDFQSDISNVRKGWYLDDILVTGTPAAPANDLFANARIIADAAGVVSGSSSNATKELNEPNHAGNAGGHSVWFRWTPPASGQYFFRTGGSAFDTLLAVYTGDSVDNLALVAQNDDVNPVDRSSRVSAYFIAGTSYSIAVDGYNGAVGGLALNWGQDFQSVVINFDNLNAGTTVSNHYHAQGVDFRQSLGNVTGYLLPVVQSAAQAESDGQVADLAGCNNCGEFFTVQAAGVFTSFKQHVRVNVGYFPIQSGIDTARVTLRAFDLANNLLGQSAVTVVSGAGFHAVLQFDSPVTNIASFVILTDPGQDQNKHVGIDNLTFDLTAPGQPPDFAISPDTTSLTVRQGTSVTNTITVLRFNGSTGTLQFSAMGLPTGVTASFSPNPADNSTWLTLTVTSNAFPNGNSPATVTVSASPLSPGAGPAPRSAAISLYVRANFSVHIEGASPFHVPSCGISTGTVAVSRELTFNGVVTLSASGLPNQFQVSFNPSTLDFHDGGAVNRSVMTVYAGETPPYKDFVLLVRGASAALPDSLDAVGIHTEYGRVDSFSPTSGMAPQSLQPGTEVVIRGAGFCSGSSVMFGNFYAITNPVSISADGSELHVRVPRLATDGALTVLAPDGTPFVSATPFAVHSYRNTHGFSFVNSDFFQNRVGGYSFNDTVELFGSDQTHILNPFCPFVCPDIPDPFALIFTGVADRALQSGQCFGFGLSSQRLLHGDKPYGAFPLQQGLATPTAWNLAGPDEGSSPELARYIHLQHLAQFSSQYVKFWATSAFANWRNATSLDISNQVAGRLLAGDHPLVAIRKDTDGHVLVAYDLEPGDGPGDFYIRVYDPNRPFVINENSDSGLHKNQEEDSRIHVTPDGHWTHNHNGNVWMNDFSGLVVAPYDVVPIRPTLPTTVAGLTLLILGDAARTVQVADAAGHTLLNADGTLNPDPATGLSNAIPFAPLANQTAGSGDIFALSGSGEFIQTINGTAIGAYTHTILGHEFALRLLDVAAAPGVNDTVTLDAESPTLQFQTGGATKPIKVQLMARVPNGLVRVATITTTTFNVGSDSFAFDPIRQKVRCTHAGPATLCTIVLSQVDRQGNPAAFVAAPVLIGAGEVVTFDPSDWDNLSETPLVVTWTAPGGQFRQSTLLGPPSAQWLPSGSFHGFLRGHIGMTYTIQASSDFVHWATVTVLPCVDGTLEFTDPATAGFSQRFYRAVSSSAL